MGNINFEVRELAVLSAAMAFLFSPPAGSSTISGKVGMLQSRASDGLQYVVVKGNSDLKPACAKNTYYMIKDEKSDAGKAQFAMLMSAYLSGKAVTIYGTGQCGRWSDGEDINAVEYFDM